MLKKCFLFYLPLLLMLPSITYAERLHPEKWYQMRWCEKHNGHIEIIMPDRTRCDCITPDHAVEFDFADHWYQAIGQSLHYALQTGKRAGVVLIMETKEDQKYWMRLNTVIRYYDLPIDIWCIDPQ